LAEPQTASAIARYRIARREVAIRLDQFGKRSLGDRLPVNRHGDRTRRSRLNLARQRVRHKRMPAQRVQPLHGHSSDRGSAGSTAIIPIVRSKTILPCASKTTSHDVPLPVSVHATYLAAPPVLGPGPSCSVVSSKRRHFGLRQRRSRRMVPARFTVRVTSLSVLPQSGHLIPSGGSCSGNDCCFIPRAPRGDGGE
jgi:hypothetical protein